MKSCRKKAVEMAHALREKGILFTIATGRVECMAEKICSGVGYTDSIYRM